MKKLSYLQFVLKYRKLMRHVDAAGKLFIYEIYKESTNRLFGADDVKDIIDYHYECVAILEYSI